MRELQEQLHPLAHGCRRQRFQVGDIRPVHAEDEVEAVKIQRRDLARLLPGDVDAVAHRHSDRAWIGGGADLPATGCR
ncbi:hypothetical protein ASD99_09680 [Mesorhizobium sp. Root695]|nr:hypothetical protein ASD99_09680 [Mesorhizobium sp. Root695]